MKYFELKNDMRILDRWTLDEPIDAQGHEIWHGQFSDGHPLSLQTPPRMGVYVRGRALHFTTTALGVPVVHGKLKALFEQLGLQDQMQLFPVTVDGQSAPYFLMNLLIVSERVKQAMEGAGITGMRFTEV